MKKTITAILAIIMLISMSTVAFAAVDTAYPVYTGTDFSDEAVYERLIAVKEQFPDGTLWNTTKPN